MTLDQAGYLALSTITLAGAFGAVLLKNVARALLSLVLFFFGVAGLFFAMHAEFVGVVQVLVYVGAVAVLVLFAIVLVRTPDGPSDVARLGGWRPVGVAAAFIVGALLVGAVLRSPQPTTPPAQQAAGAEEIGEALMTKYVLPFEIASVLLTATLVGAVVIALDEGKRASGKKRGEP